MADEHAGHRQRMRERFRTHGLEGFAPHEVLELILFYAIPQRNVNPLAHRLLNHFGSFNAVLDAPVEELQKVDGMGEYAATLFSLFAHAARKYNRGRLEEKPPLRNRAMAEAHCIALMQGLRDEHFYAVCLDGQMRVTHDALISHGTINQTPAYPRLVAEAVLRHNAHAVLLCHNHPGGTAMPSSRDVEMTRELGAMLSSIDVALADHIIVAQGRAFSMVGCGLIAFDNQTDAVTARVADSAGELLIRSKLEKQAKGTK